MKKIEVFPRNKMYADFIDGKEVMIIWDNRTAPKEKERVISDSDDGTIFTPYLNCGVMVQQEFELFSKNVKMGFQFRYQNGEVQINHNWFLGYTKDENGHLIIDEEQAVVVRRIFREYL